MPISKPAGKGKLLLIIIIAAVVIITSVAIAAFAFSNREDDRIVGSWVLVEIQGDYASDLDFFIGLMETFYPDGTGVSYFPLPGGLPHEGSWFTWTIRGNYVTMVSDFDEDDIVVQRFRITDSRLITNHISIDSEISEPDTTWIWDRID